MKKIVFLVFYLVLIAAISRSYAEDGFTQRDRELLIELKVKVQENN